MFGIKTLERKVEQLETQVRQLIEINKKQEEIKEDRKWREYESKKVKGVRVVEVKGSWYGKYKTYVIFSKEEEVFESNNKTEIGSFIDGMKAAMEATK